VFLRLLIALIMFGVAGGGVYYVVSGRETKHRAAPSASASVSVPSTPSALSASPSPTPSLTHSPTPSPTGASGEPVYGAAPKACTVPDRATYTRLVPEPRVQTGGDPASTICLILSGKEADASLRVEARLFPAAQHPDPVQAASDFFAADLAEARQPSTLTTTIALDSRTDLGDQAFTWSREDKGLPTIVAEVEIRSRNAVLRVTYSHDPGAQETNDAASHRFLTGALQAARQVLAAYA
jgi:hypothetical protein